MMMMMGDGATHKPQQLLRATLTLRRLLMLLMVMLPALPWMKTVLGQGVLCCCQHVATLRATPHQLQHQSGLLLLLLVATQPAVRTQPSTHPWVEVLLPHPLALVPRRQQHPFQQLLSNKATSGLAQTQLQQLVAGQMPKWVLQVSPTCLAALQAVALACRT